MELLHFDAGRDNNGNPRRFYAAFNGGVIIGAWDEGYRGAHCVPVEYRDAAARAPTIPTTAAYRREILRNF